MYVTETVDKFVANIAEIALDLVHAYGLTYGATGALEGQMAMQRWMDYRLRHVAAQPREVKKSSRFPVQNMPETVIQALNELEARFELGEDVNPYLSKTTIGNDVSAGKHLRRTDGMWADWGIHHLHLTSEPLAMGERYSERSDWLLFVRVFDDVVAFIDVRSHNEADLWSQEELVKTFIDTWPEQAKPWRVENMVNISPSKAPGDHKLLRNAGVNIPVEHSGKYYLGQGGGLTSALTSTAASMECIAVNRNARHLALWLDHPENPIRLELASHGVAQPEFFLGVSADGLVIAEATTSARTWILPSVDQQGKRSCLAEIQERLLPAWAIPTLISHVEQA